MKKLLPSAGVTPAQSGTRLAETYLKKVGAIDNSSRGVWSITKEGETLTDAEVRLVPARVRKQIADDRRTRGSGGVTSDPDDIATEEQLEASDAFWKDKLLDLLRNLRPDAFKRLAQRILREAGFIKVEVTGRSGDGGIDGIGVLRVNLLSFQVLFQCKRYQSSVGSGAIRDFRGAMVGRSDKGLPSLQEHLRQMQSVRRLVTARPRLTSLMVISFVTCSKN